MNLLRRALVRAVRRLPSSWIVAVGRRQFTGPPGVRAVIRLGARVLSSGEGRIARGPGAGLAFDPDGMNAGYLLGTTEPRVQALLVETLRPGGVFYDVGACVGFFSCIAARLVGEEGAVYAFEPLPRNARTVARNASSNGFDNVTVVQAAVAAEPGVATLVGTRREAGTIAGAHSPAEGVEVRVESLDELVASGRVRPPTLVKIDVEELELDVLRGMKRILRDHRPVVVVELHWQGAAFGEVAQEELAGYVVEALDAGTVLHDIVYTHAVARPRAIAMPAPRTSSV